MNMNRQTHKHTHPHTQRERERETETERDRQRRERYTPIHFFEREWTWRLLISGMYMMTGSVVSWSNSAELAFSKCSTLRANSITATCRKKDGGRRGKGREKKQQRKGGN